MHKAKNPFDAIETILEKLDLAQTKAGQIDELGGRLESLTVEIIENADVTRTALEDAQTALELAQEASDAAGIACDHLRGVINDARNILVDAIPGTKLETLIRQVLRGAKNALEAIDPAPPGVEEEEESDDSL